MSTVTQPVRNPRASARATPAAQTNGRPKSLFHRHFRKVVFSTHVWEGEYVVPEINATLGGQVLDKSRVGKPPASLMPGDLAKKVRLSREGVYKALNSFAFPCDSKGTRLVPTSSESDFIDAFTTATNHFNAVADEVAEKYDEIIRYNRDYWFPRCAVYRDEGEALKRLEAAKLARTQATANSQLSVEQLTRLDEDVAVAAAEVEAQYDPAESEARYQQLIGRKIPSPKDLRERFAVEYVLAEPDDQAGRYENPALREFFQKAHERAEEQAEELVRAVVEKPAALLAERLQTLKQRIADGQKLSPASFAEVSEAINLCRSCGEALAPSMREHVEEVSRSIQVVLGKADAMKRAGGTYTEAVKANANVLSRAFDACADAAEQKIGQAEMLQRYGLRGRRIRSAD